VIISASVSSRLSLVGSRARDRSDRVMALTHFRDGAGGYAELAVVDAGLVAAIGPVVSFTAAPATPLAA